MLLMLKVQGTLATGYGGHPQRENSLPRQGKSVCERPNKIQRMGTERDAEIGTSLFHKGTVQNLSINMRILQKHISRSITYT